MNDYPPEWHTGEIQAHIRALAQHTCEICGLRFDPTTNKALSAVDADGRPIVGHVHHLDQNPAHCADDNLMFLCQPCHIRLHGQRWLPGAEMPLAWGNEPPPWVLRRGLSYKPNPIVASLQESARYATGKIDRAQFLIGLIESQGWIRGDIDARVEMRALLQQVLTEYDTLHQQRVQAAEEPILAAAAAWASENGFVPYAEALKLSGLDDHDFEEALIQGLFTPEPMPFEQGFVPRYFDPAQLHLDDDTVRSLWSNVLLTREQAAQLLDIPLAAFERRRREVGIRHVRTDLLSGTGQRERLYRKIDVLKLKR